MPTPPDWFQRAIATPADDRFVEVDGIPIHYRKYAHAADRPLLVFVHGHAAHAHWWDFIAPAFSDRYNVLAMDLAGSGDSGHRDVYSARTFSDEIIEVCRSERGTRGTLIVGHSFGGSMTRIAAWRFGRELDGIVLADSVIADRRADRPPVPRSKGRIRYYETLEAGKRRFRLRPPQPLKHDFIIDHIAAHSLEQTESGWRFKLDQDVFAKMIDEPALDIPDGVTTLREMACPAALIYGEHSRFFPEAAVALARQAIAEGQRVRRVADAHHHVFLDQPLPFIEALGEVLDTF